MEGEKIAIPVSDFSLSGRLFLPQSLGGQGKAALLLHGWRSAQDRQFSLAEKLAAAEYTVLTVDLRGHGETPGDLNRLSRKDFLDDVLAAYDFLSRQPGVDAAKIGVLGSSFGAYLAALVTAARPTAWLTMRVPADYPDRSFELPKLPDGEDKAAWRSQRRTWEETAAMRALHGFTGPVLIVEAENDELVPRQVILNYLGAAGEKAEHRVIAGAPHSFTRFPEFKEQFNDIVLDWLARKV